MIAIPFILFYKKLNLRRYYPKICKTGKGGGVDHIKYSLYLNLELFICYNFGHFKIKSLFFTRREIYNNQDNRIPIISSVNSRKYIVKKINN